MPILKRENDVYPTDLLFNEALLGSDKRNWWCIYTLARREKDFMRKLAKMEIPHYGPMISKRFRSPNGRLRNTFVPLFPSYVFMLATEEERYQAMTTNCISKYNIIDDREQLVSDLRQVFEVVTAGVPLTPEARLETGASVRVKNGPFAGCEGVVLRREGKTRLLLSVRYLEQGVSMDLDEGLLEPI